MPDTTLRDAVRRGRRRTSPCPPASRPWPGVVVLHEAARAQRRHPRAGRPLRRARLPRARARPVLVRPAEGAAACSPPSGRCRSARGRRSTRSRPPARALAERSDATGRVGVIGFCMGGGFALLAAPRGRVQASSVNYGVVPEGRRRDVLRGACPMVGDLRRRATASCAARRGEARGRARARTASSTT